MSILAKKRVYSRNSHQAITASLGCMYPGRLSQRITQGRMLIVMCLTSQGEGF